jgi:hypothetical protein
MLSRVTTSDPGGDRGPMRYPDSGFYPVEAPAEIFVNWRGKLGPNLWLKITAKKNNKSLRGLAKEYGVSHEAIRRTLVAAASKR